MKEDVKHNREERVPKAELIKRLDRRLRERGHTFASIAMKTKPQLKVAAPFTNLVKFAKYRVGFGAIYENSVNNQSKREGREANFKASAPSWGARASRAHKTYDNGSFKSKEYLCLHKQYTLRSSYEDRFDDGDFETIPEEEVAPFLRKKSQAKQNGNVAPIRHFTPNIDSVIYIQVDKTRYIPI